MRCPCEVPEVEADILELQVRPHEDERLPICQALEELLSFTNWTNTSTFA